MQKIFHNFKKKYNSSPIQIRASFWFLICSFLQKGISVLTTPIFTRLLSTAEYGQYNVFNSWTDVVTILVSLRLSYGVYPQGLVKFEENRKTFSSSLQGLNLTLCAGWTIIYLIFHQLFNRLLGLSTLQMLCMLLMVWATEAFHFWASEQRVEFKYRHLVTLTLAVSLLKPLIGIWLVTVSQDKVTARIAGLAFVELIGYSGLFAVQMFRGKKFFSQKIWTYAISFNLPLIPHYLSQTVLNSSDRIMISNLVGNAEAGIYGLACSIAYVMTFFNTALMHTLSPWVYQKIKNKRIKDIGRVAYIALITIALVNLIIILFAPEAVAVFAPPKYHDAIWVIPPVSMSALFMFSYDLFAKFEMYYEKTGYVMGASLVCAILNLILNFIFINSLGYVAAAYTTLFSYILCAVIHYVFMYKICKKFLNGEQVYNVYILLGIVIGTLALGFLFMMTYNIPVLRYAIAAGMLICCIIFRKQLLAKAKIIFEIRKNKNT